MCFQQDVNLPGKFSEIIGTRITREELVEANLYDHSGMPIPVDDPFALVLRDNKA
ncbi:MAG: hypothetical protein ABIG61_02740 [Planctomycetota bacterium]